MGSSIVVDQLTKVYRTGVRALGGVSFAVEQGEVFAYLGRNGSGKTTTVRILTTLTTASGGSASVAGFDVTASPLDVRRSIGATMQEAALDLSATAKEHLEFVARLWSMHREAARQRATELLERFDLASAGDQLLRTFSGGMRRRLDLATALINRPAVLFLDEPTTGLDPQSRRALWEEIRLLRSDGATIFLTTQYLEEAEVLADRVAIIANGQIIACDSPGVLKTAIGRTTVELKLADDTRRDSAHRLLKGSARLLPASAGLLRFEMTGNGASTRRVHEFLSDLREQGIGLDGLSIRESSLEDVFVRLTGEHISEEAQS